MLVYRKLQVLGFKQLSESVVHAVIVTAHVAFGDVWVFPPEVISQFNHSINLIVSLPVFILTLFNRIDQILLDWRGMKMFANKRGNVLVLKRGEELHEALNEYARKYSLSSAWLQGLGGAGAVTLGFYDIETKSYKWHELDGPLEILNLTGNLAWMNNKPVWHIHGTFSERDGRAVGGHVKTMTVGLTCELLITPLETELTRQFDDETGLNLLT